MTGLIDRRFAAGLDDDVRRNPTSLLERQGAQRVKDSRNLLARIPIGPDGGATGHSWLKAFRPEGPLDGAARLFRPSKAERAWNMAMALLERGIETPRPLLGMRGDGPLGAMRGLLVVEDVEGAEQLRLLLRRLDPESPERRALLQELGGFLARLHGAGFWHRDFSGGNALVRGNDDGTWRFTLVDINRMRQAGSLGDHQRMRDLERIRLSDSDIEVFFHAYEGAGGRPLASMYRTRAERYRRMREAKSAWGRLTAKARYYWDDLRG